MWRVFLFLLLGLCVEVSLSAQNVEDEEMDPYEVERLSEYIERPVRINVASLSALKVTGLMSHYQVISLMDYRSRHGDVLSLTELAAVDGFGDETVARIAPFISLYSSRLPGAGREERFRIDNDLAVKAGLDCAYALKYRVRYDDFFVAGLSASRSKNASGYAPDAYSGFISVNFRRRPLKVMIGDFNARFGQGLALWNGMSISGLSTPESFSRNAAGISSSWSFTGTSSFTGVAAEASWRRFTFSLMSAFPGIKSADSPFSEISVLPAVNASWNGRRSHVGVTHYAEFSGLPSAKGVRIPDMKTSVDASVCLDGTDFFSEVALDWVNVAVAAVAVASFPAGDRLRMTCLLRCYPPGYEAGRSGAPRIGTGCTNEYGMTLGGRIPFGAYMKISGKDGFGSSRRRNDISFSVDACLHPVPKSGAKKSVQATPVLFWDVLMSGSTKFSLRLKERFRTWGHPFRTDVRADFQWWSSFWNVTMRLNLLQCVSLGSLAYVECGYGRGGLAFHLRQGAFLIDEWDDRIYVYERDAPGSFNVPALYGRGVWTSVAGSWKFSRWGKVYLRGSFTSYPFMKENKSGKAELKFQCVFSF